MRVASRMRPEGRAKKRPGANIYAASASLADATATNTWTAWYTPLAYPHPLRSILV